MIPIEEMEILLDEVASELPEAFFKELNGGIILMPEVKMHSKDKGNDLFILGEYHRDNLGRYITMYYGSFMKTFGYFTKEQLREKLRDTLLHEFTHHFESMAGERSLEIKDAQEIAEYMRRYKK